MSKIHIQIGEKTFTTKKDIIEFLDVSPTTFSKYVKENAGDIDKAVSAIMDMKKAYEYKGKTYSSILKLAEATKMNRKTLTKLLENNEGHSIEEIIDKFNSENRSGPYKYGEEEFATLREASEKLKMNIGTISKYLNLADNDLEKAVELYKDEHTYATVDEQRFASSKELAKYLEISATTLDKYVKEYGSIDKAIGPIKEYVKSRYNVNIEINGVLYTSAEQFAKKMKMGMPTFRKLYKEANGDMQKVYELSLTSRVKRPRNFEGKTYKSQGELLKDKKIPKATFFNNKEKLEQENPNITDEEVVDYILKQREENEKKKQQKLEASNRWEKRMEEAREKAEEKKKAKEARQAEKKIYSYLNKEYPTILGLAKETRVDPSTLGRYLKKYSVEKAVFLARKNQRKTKVQIAKDLYMNQEEIAQILGMTEREAEEYFADGITIDKIKEALENDSKKERIRQKNSSVLMYDDKTTLAKYCIENGINYKVISYQIKTYGKTAEEAIENYKQNGQETPVNWIYDRYNVLLKHLMLNERLDYRFVINEIGKKNITLEQAIENYFINKHINTKLEDSEWKKELYYTLTSPEYTTEEKKELIKELDVSESEIELVEKISKDTNRVKRRILLYDIAEAIESKAFEKDTNELVDLMKEYKITNSEIETIFTDLYVDFENKVKLGEKQPERKNKIQIGSWILNFDKISEEDKKLMQEKLPEVFEQVSNTHQKMNFFKEQVNGKEKIEDKDEKVFAVMRRSVGKQVANNSNVRQEIEDYIKNARVH